MRPLRVIHTQGDLDGACFLYAVANAYTALTHQAPSLEGWARGLRQLPHVIDFMDGCVGTTGGYTTEPGLLEPAANRVLEALSGEPGKLRAGLVPSPCDLSSVGRLISPSSVAVFRYDGGAHHARDVDHWVCGVAADPSASTVHVACSIRYLDASRVPGQVYEELPHRECARHSNDFLSEAHKFRIVPGSVLHVRIA